MKLVDKTRSRLGDFWWWSLLLFLALRSGDVINAVVGLWLVPKYVGQEQLGAVLPLTQVASVFGLPISILVITFTKFLNQYHTKGEVGKVKALIRSFWGLSLVAIAIGTAAAVFLLPHFFERIRVVSGSLGFLIIATAVLGTTAPVFTNGLQALKKFKAITIMNLFGAPIRLVVMLVAMPFRALSGYMLGQASVPACQIIWSWFSLRKEIDRSIKPVPFWREDGRKMMRYTLGVALWMGVGTIVPAVQTMIIRQRFPEVEAAAFYVITRIAELSTYAGLSIVVIMFPLAAESSVKRQSAEKLLFKSMSATMVFGLLCVGGLCVCGKWLFSHVPLWTPYTSYVPCMLWLTLFLTLSVVEACFYNFQIAQNKMGFLWYVCPISVVQLVVVAGFSGYSFFYGKLPTRFVDWMADYSLDGIQGIILVYGSAVVAQFLCVIAHGIVSRGRRNG